MTRDYTVSPPPITTLTTVDGVITAVAGEACKETRVVTDESPASAEVASVGQGKLIVTVPTKATDTL